MVQSYSKLTSINSISEDHIPSSTNLLICTDECTLWKDENIMACRDDIIDNDFDCVALTETWSRMIAILGWLRVMPGYMLIPDHPCSPGPREAGM